MQPAMTRHTIRNTARIAAPHIRDVCAEDAWAVITDGKITDIELDLDDAYEVEKKRRRRRNGHKPVTQVAHLKCYWPCQLHS